MNKILEKIKTENSPIALNYLLIIIVVVIIISGIVLSISSDVVLSENVISLIKDNKCEYIYTFLDTNNQNQKELLTEILNRTTFSIKKESINDNNITNITLDVSVPSFASSLIKIEPNLFTYNNVNYVNNKLKSISQEEYLDNIISKLKNEISTTKTFYTDRIEINVKIENGQYILINYENLENVLLGGIYNYQNSDVSFLTFNDLIFPQSSGPSQAAVSVTSILDVQSVSGTTYSSPDFLINRGEIASYQGNIDLPDGKKTSARLSITVVGIQKNVKNTAVKIKIKSENDISISPQYFQVSADGELLRPETNDNILATKDSSEWTLTFNTIKDIDYISFNSSLFFA